ncbi:MAG: hypothetical protein KDC10_15560 [Calditrichaeota bacterium]|nr:hypothetical protein [Calditrichota bacterium]
MDELFKSIRHFLARDIAFVVGGNTLLIAAAYSFEVLPLKDLPAALWIACIGFAWVLGYALQDGASVIGIVGTDFPRKLSGPIKAIFKHFTGEEWKQPEVHDDLEKMADAIVGEARIAEFERIRTLLQVGCTMTPAMMASTIVLVFPVNHCHKNCHLITASTILSIVFFVLARLKRAQTTHFLMTHGNTSSSSNTSSGHYSLGE